MTPGVELWTNGTLVMERSTSPTPIDGVRMVKKGQNDAHGVHVYIPVLLFLFLLLHITDTSSLAQFEVVGVDTQVGPDGSKVHHSQLSHLAGSVGKELNNEAGLISEGTSSSSLPSLQKEPEKEIAIQSPISGSLQQEPEEETTTQFHVDHSSGSL
ncbi:hypothetical protein V6N11_032160 [Hibiscus sabdariffa]|uniref:Uncharacterized protein n=1 Tax=Hibiscus sabdariffa TaxID=183260 RepID=A0ABR2SZU6_9ROSI